MEKFYIGVDIGGTNTVIGLFDRSLRLLDEDRLETPRPDTATGLADPLPFFDRLAERIRRLAGQQGDGRLAGVGIASPGRVDVYTGVVRRASNLGWQEAALRDEMARRLMAPVCIEHDVRAFLLGEATFGAAAGCRDAIGVTIGTGLAAAFLTDGGILRGGSMRGGEIGHDKVEGGDWPCSCGKIGCLETIVSARGLARAAALAVADGKIPALRDGEITAERLHRACLDGDADAAAIYARAAEVLAGKLATLIYAFDPQLVLVGGGVAKAGAVLLEPLRRAVGARCPDRMPPLLILPTALGDRAGLLGMAYIAKTAVEEGRTVG